MISLGWSGTNLWQLRRPKFVAAHLASLKCQNCQKNLFAFHTTRNPASRASQRARLVAMYIAVAIRPSSYVHKVTSEVAVSF